MAVFLACLSAFAPTAWAKYNGGTGDPNDPYRIAIAEDLNDIGNHQEDFNKYFILTNDVNLAQYTNTAFNIIGRLVGPFTPGKPFTGVFDGNDHKIWNFTWDSNGIDRIGLFGCVFGGQIKNLGMENVNVNVGNRNYVGGLVGESNGGTITNCYSTGSVSGGAGVGGLVGHTNSRVIDCYSTSSVTGRGEVGGLVGSSWYPTIINCYSTGSVTGNGDYVGGLMGDNYQGTITNCYSAGNVLGVNRVGGLIGSNGGTITKCYSTGGVLGNYDVGGLAGYQYGFGIIIGSFWDTNTSSQSTSAGGTGKTTAQMQDPNTFRDANWDFVGETDGPSDIWAMPAGCGYPILYWQLVPLPSLPAFSGGSGTPTDPYVIANPADINSIGHNPRLMDKHFVLVEDINLAQERFYIIGSKVFPFTGVFDGNDHKIWNLTWDSNSIDYVGLFGYVGGGSQIKNLGMGNMDVNCVNGNYIGGLAGYNYYGTITNCYSAGSVLGIKLSIGRLVGHNYYGTITNCYSTGSVTGTGDVGGLVGYNYYGTITNCYSTGSISGTDDVGGLVGYNYYGTITNCYSTDSVTGNVDFVGGLVGCSYDSTITNCYFAGSVSGHGCTGGLVGYNRGRIIHCYSTGGVTAGNGDNVGGLAGVNNYTILDCYSTGNVTGNGDYVGGLVGCNYYGYYGDITNCYATGNVTGHQYVGGLVGANEYYDYLGGSIYKCYSIGSITGTSHVGGLVGYNSRWIKYSYSTGGVTANGDYVGGLVGRNIDGGDIINCYSTGSVSGNKYIGGLVGQNRYQQGEDNHESWVESCYSVGKVKGESAFGGLLGDNYGGTVKTSFWDMNTSGQLTSAGGTGKTTAEMKTKSTFTDAGWDFVNIWDICEATDYPRLQWQILAGDFLCPYGVDFTDFAFLALAWRTKPNDMDWKPVCDISQPKDNFIDEFDLAIFCDNWLEGPP